MMRRQHNEHAIKIFRTIVMNRAIRYIDKYTKCKTYGFCPNNEGLNMIKKIFENRSPNDSSKIFEYYKVPYNTKLVQELINYCWDKILCPIFPDNRCIELKGLKCYIVFYGNNGELYHEIMSIITLLLFIEPWKDIGSKYIQNIEKFMYETRYKIFLLREICNLQIVDDVVNHMIYFLIMTI